MKDERLQLFGVSLHWASWLRVSCMRWKCQRHRGLSGYPRMIDCAGPLTFCSHLEKPTTLRSLANPPHVGHVDLFPAPFTATWTAISYFASIFYTLDAGRSCHTGRVRLIAHLRSFLGSFACSQEIIDRRSWNDLTLHVRTCL